MINKIKDQFKKYAERLPQEKWQTIIPLGVILILIIIVIIVYAVPCEKAAEEGVAEPESELAEQEARLIDGVLVDKDHAAKMPFTVMIENHWQSRPPSGLSDASLVFEAPTEAGITRFLAIYDHSFTAEEIGPVRSARDYYLDWAAEFKAIYAHCGGSPQALQKIPDYPIYDLNQFYNGRFFWRDSERSAPHNVYTNGDLLREAVVSKQIDNTANFSPWLFKDEMPQEQPSVQRITLDFSTPEYRTIWSYASDTNEYMRFHDDEEHRDKDGSRILTKNIAVMVTEAKVIDYEGRLELRTTGRGNAWVFRDGGMLEATWSKANPESRLRFYDVTGREIELNRGNTWIEVIIDRWDLSWE